MDTNNLVRGRNQAGNQRMGLHAGFLYTFIHSWSEIRVLQQHILVYFLHFGTCESLFFTCLQLDIMIPSVGGSSELKLA